MKCAFSCAMFHGINDKYNGFMSVNNFNYLIKAKANIFWRNPPSIQFSKNFQIVYQVTWAQNKGESCSQNTQRTKSLERASKNKISELDPQRIWILELTYTEHKTDKSLIKKGRHKY